MQKKKKMIFSAFAVGVLLHPPPGGPWRLESLALEDASATIRAFASTYPTTPDFRVDFPLATSRPQGFLALRRGDDIRLVVHFWETREEHYRITTIAMAHTECEAPKAFFAKLVLSPDLSLDPVLLETQPRWRMLARYYVDW